jgi:hypothetical protein
MKNNRIGILTLTLIGLALSTPGYAGWFSSTSATTLEQERAVTAALDAVPGKDVANACLPYALRAGAMLFEKFHITSTAIVYSGLGGWVGSHMVLVYEIQDRGNDKIRRWLVDNGSEPFRVRWTNSPNHWIWEYQMGIGYNFSIDKVVHFPLSPEGQVYVGQLTAANARLQQAGQ